MQMFCSSSKFPPGFSIHWWNLYCENHDFPTSALIPHLTVWLSAFCYKQEPFPRSRLFVSYSEFLFCNGFNSLQYVIILVLKPSQIWPVRTLQSGSCVLQHLWILLEPYILVTLFASQSSCLLLFSGTLESGNVSTGRTVTVILIHPLVLWSKLALRGEVACQGHTPRAGRRVDSKCRISLCLSNNK